MRTGNNLIESHKATKGGVPLRIAEDLPRLIGQGWEALSAADRELLKWLGVFLRKPTPGKFMMRIRMPNGFASSEQLAAIAGLSERLGDSTVDVTTRQQLELRGYTLESLPEIWARLRGVNLRSLQTGMDNVRNLNGCPLAGLTPHELFDASSMVLDLDRIIVGENGNPEYANLPRKFNVTVTGCRENCTHNESQDLALVPATKRIGGQRRPGFHVLVGGKMGSGGFTIAQNLGWFIDRRQAVDLALAVIKLFRDEGPRDARNKIRLAFMIQSWGLERFRDELAARLGWKPLPAGEDARLARHNDHLGVQEQKQPGLCSVGLKIPVGRTRPEQLRELARLAESYGTGHVRLTTGQNAILVNVPQGKVAALLAEPLLKQWPAEAPRFERRMVACVGTEYCNLALIETKEQALRVSRELGERLNGRGPAPSIHWSGCPAGCGNHAAADIGLRGMKINVGGEIREGVAIYVGGCTGPNAREGRQILDMVPCDEKLPEVLAKIIEKFRVPGSEFRVEESDTPNPEPGTAPSPSFEANA
jgi:ferredoxin-nitrite reductase